MAGVRGAGDGVGRIVTIFAGPKRAVKVKYDPTVYTFDHFDAHWRSELAAAATTATAAARAATADTAATTSAVTTPTPTVTATGATTRAHITGTEVRSTGCAAVGSDPVPSSHQYVASPSHTGFLNGSHDGREGCC